MKWYIGIDPGKSGAYAALSSVNGETIIDTENFVTAQLAYEWMKDKKLDGGIQMVALEHVHAFPKQGVTSVFTFGENYGFWQGLLLAGQVPFTYVTPIKWQREVLDSKRKGDTKALAVEYVNRVFPFLKLRPSHHGKADAVCLALYAKKSV